MSILKILEKIKIRLWAKIVSTTRFKSYYPNIYSSYWHYRLFSTNRQGDHLNYYTAIPNRGAGIGHQMANWIAGYWFARQFGLRFAYTAFSNEKWEQFLGFGEDETSLDELTKNGFKKVRLPLFDEFNPEEIALTKKIIESYNDQRVVFVAEQDQGYQNQYGVMDALKSKFHNAPARKCDVFFYRKDHFNIAIHVRRGDIVSGKNRNEPNMLLRWQDSDYFKNALSNLLKNLQTSKPIKIYLFSQGNLDEFKDFEEFNNVVFCLEIGAQESFLHMVYADLLITSKSSFSYKPALLSNGIKVCPPNFWHGYPNDDSWLIANEDGTLDDIDLKKLAKL